MSPIDTLTYKGPRCLVCGYPHPTLLRRNKRMSKTLRKQLARADTEPNLFGCGNCGHAMINDGGLRDLTPEEVSRVNAKRWIKVVDFNVGKEMFG